MCTGSAAAVRPQATHRRPSTHLPQLHIGIWDRYISGGSYMEDRRAIRTWVHAGEAVGWGGVGVQDGNGLQVGRLRRQVAVVAGAGAAL